MIDDADQSEEEIAGASPAALADIFFTLVAVVVIMLLMLAPSLRTPGALAAGRTPPWEAPLLVGGKEALVLTARSDGLSTASLSGRAISLSGLFADPALRASLTEAARSGRPIVLMIAPDGGEAGFLFDALAASLGVKRVEQIRMDRDCRFLVEPAAGRTCAVSAWEERRL